MLNIGKNIKKIRRFKNITQEEISEKLAITPQAYSRIESGETKLDTLRLQQIADILEISLQDIYDLDDKTFILNQQINPQNPINNGLIIQSDNQPLIDYLKEINKKQTDEIAFLRQQITFLNDLLIKQKNT